MRDDLRALLARQAEAMESMARSLAAVEAVVTRKGKTGNDHAFQYAALAENHPVELVKDLVSRALVWIERRGVDDGVRRLLRDCQDIGVPAPVWGPLADAVRGTEVG